MDESVLYGALVVFWGIGGLELVDRTIFSLIALASGQSPIRTWAGGALGFALSTVIAVTIGALFVALVGPNGISYLRIGGGAFLIAYALWLLLREEKSEPSVRALGSAIASAFLLTILLELGDTTMILEIAFVPTYGWLVVLVAGALALMAVAALAAFLGGRLGARVEPATLNRVVVAVLLIVGAVTILYGLAPGYFTGIG